MTHTCVHIDGAAEMEGAGENEIRIGFLRPCYVCNIGGRWNFEQTSSRSLELGGKNRYLGLKVRVSWRNHKQERALRKTPVRRGHVGIILCIGSWFRYVRRCVQQLESINQLSLSLMEFRRLDWFGGRTVCANRREGRLSGRTAVIRQCNRPDRNVQTT